MNEQEWMQRLAAGRERVARLQERLAAGESEADAAHAEGFLTRRDVDAAIPGASGSLRRG